MDIVTTSNFHATLLQGTPSVSVVFIPAQHVRQCCWPLLTLLLYGGCSFDENEGTCANAADPAHVCRSAQTEIFSVVSDKDGATVFMDPRGVEIFSRAGMGELVTVAPQAWRAIQIHLGPMVAEFPGIVSFLSKLLATDKISILNMSTYDTDIIYVQESTLDAAIACLQSKLARGVHGLIEAKDAERALHDRLSGSSQELESGAVDAIDAAATDAEEPLLPVVGSGQYLVVYPESLVIVRLRKDAIRKCAYGLTQQVLLSYGSLPEGDRGSSAEEPAESTREEQRLRDAEMVSFWSYCETAEEISLIVTERYLESFEDDAIIVSPDRWRAIKLCGRTYGFDETGVVAAMSGFSTDTQVLNVSSFGSNVTFVLDHTLDASIDTLCSSLSITHVER
ncbi:hypothetical protein PybrP1_002202 [[Pythium] brassicae (nom. inval.)]|nr:hypothetical protein PybrP1_002202 [[Pythium] brassicae (nom. inval.)]